MGKIFGTSGARGVTNREITPEFAFRVAAIYGVMLREKKGSRPQVVVAHDQRFGADMLAYAVIAGFQSVGCDVVMLGMVSTGVYSVFLQQGGVDGGILVTGSHMPPDRIGIIPMLGNAHYADRDVTDGLEASLVTWELLEDRYRVALEEVGTVSHRVNTPSSYVYTLSHRLGRWEVIAEARFHVLLDPGNGTSGAVATELLNQLGCRVTVMNGEAKPIPNRPSECSPATCAAAITRMREGDFQLGACFDGDGDRVKFITREGLMLSDDVVAAIFARHCLEPGQVYVTPVNASGLLRWAVETRGGRLVECRIGQPDTDTKVREHQAAMASESNAGKFGFRELQCCYDGPYAVAKMLQIMAVSRGSLATLAGELPRFYQAAVRLEVKEARKAAVVAKAIQAVEAQLSGEIERLDTTDGTKWFLTNQRWLLLRPSGTEPVVRAYADARSQFEADVLIARARQAFEYALSG